MMNEVVLVRSDLEDQVSLKFTNIEGRVELRAAADFPATVAPELFRVPLSVKLWVIGTECLVKPCLVNVEYVAFND
jgi:hypothetical protein